MRSLRPAARFLSLRVLYSSLIGLYLMSLSPDILCGLARESR